MSKFNIGVIGCGNMGSAIVRGMLDKGIVAAEDLFVYDKDSEKEDRLAAETGASRGELSQMVRGSNLLLITVKPQDSNELFEQIHGDVVDQTVVSVMAGVSIASIVKMAGKEVPVVRAMPNLAAFVGEGVTCISHNGMIKELDEVKKIFTGVGKVLEVEEGFMNAVTAVSGSGPAYLFYLAEAMMEAAENAGLDTYLARELVKQTLYGSAVFMNASESTPLELVRKVASRGGTTEAALSVFEEKGFKNMMNEAVAKAKARSEELSGGE